MTRPPLDLEAIRQRVEAATPAPWAAMEYDDTPGDEGVCLLGAAATVTGQHMIGYFHVGTRQQQEADGAFTAHAREDVPALLAEIERLREVVAGVADYIDHESAHKFWRVDCPACDLRVVLSEGRR